MPALHHAVVVFKLVPVKFSKSLSLAAENAVFCPIPPHVTLTSVLSTARSVTSVLGVQLARSPVVRVGKPDPGV